MYDPEAWDPDTKRAWDEFVKTSRVSACVRACVRACECGADGACTRGSAPSCAARDDRNPPDARWVLAQVGQGKMWDRSLVDEGLPQVWVDLNKE